MNYFFIILFLIVIILLALVIYFQWRNFKGGEGKKGDQGLLMLQNQLNEMRQTVDQKLNDSHKQMQLNFGQNVKIVQEVSEKLTKLDETSRQVLDLKTPLQNLEDILKNPKQRGILGEYFLETVLKNFLPPGGYQMQYKFKDGDIVDAVIFSQEGIIPVDSKFSLENYNKIVLEKDEQKRKQLEKDFRQDLKNRIDETAKYIKPKEKTTEFALMYIPAEGIYYDLLINKIGAIQISTRDLIEYAVRERKVVIVSPTTFMAYLQTVLHGLRALKINQEAKEIISRIDVLGRHLGEYEDYFKKLGTHLGTTVNTYNQAYKKLAMIDKDVVKIAGGEKRVEVLEIEKPKEEEL